MITARIMFKVLLIANYLPDNQPSMLRFNALLERELTDLGWQVRTIRPKPIINRPCFKGKVSKWLGYIDKLCLFPLSMGSALKWADVVHICDHSNSVYVQYVHHRPHLVTCHDLGAVRAALGEDTSCYPSTTGRILQQWILGGLKSARTIACDSTYTRQDLERIVTGGKKITVIPVALDGKFRLLDREIAIERLGKISDLNKSQPYILHVGSSHIRKNRDGILRAFAKAKDRFAGQMVFAGQALTEDQLRLAEKLGLSQRLVQVVNPDDELIEALYNCALALLFPSRFEGFGWPTIEAQACGCPVIASDSSSLPEVLGDSALLHPVDDDEAFAQSIISLLDADERLLWVKKGRENARRYTARQMAVSYLKLYEETLRATAPQSSIAG